MEYSITITVVPHGVKSEDMSMTVNHYGAIQSAHLFIVCLVRPVTQVTRTKYYPNVKLKNVFVQAIRYTQNFISKAKKIWKRLHHY